MEFNDNNKNIDKIEENSEEKIPTSEENYSSSESNNTDLEMNDYEDTVNVTISPPFCEYFFC